MKAWIAAARPRTLPLAIAGILLGAVPSSGKELQTGWTFFLCLLTAILLQILSNFANDYGDAQNGADQFRTIGPSRAVQSGSISQSEMTRAIIVLTLITIISGMGLLWIGLWSEGWKISFWAFLSLGLAAVAAAYFYTAGKRPYGYRGLGDVSVFVFFGWVAVLGTHFLIYKSLDRGVACLGLMQGLLSVMVLHLNNMRDYSDDLKAEKITMAIRLGWKGSQRYYAAMTFLSMIALICFIAFNHRYWLFLIVLLALPLYLVLRKVWLSMDGSGLDTELKKVALSSFFIALFLFLSST